MMNETNMTSNCKSCRSHLPDMLLDSAYAETHPEVAAHLNECASCRTELAELRSTFAALDEFHAPEPSPFFNTRLHARLREEIASQPEGFFERVRSFLQFSTGRSLRPALAGALAVVLLVSGASVASLHHFQTPGTPQASSTVNDLTVLDNNESAEQQMGQLLDQSGAEDGDAQPAT